MGTARDLQRWQRILLAIVAAVLVVTGLVTYGLIREVRSASQSVSYDRAERVIDTAGIETALFQRSASARGYLLSGDALFLDSRRAANTALTMGLSSLRARTVDARALDAIEVLLARLDAATDRAIATYSTSQQDARTLWEREARPVQDQLAREIGELATVERAAARERAEDSWARSATLLAVVLGSVALLVTTLFHGYARASRALLARQEAEQTQATFRLLDQVPVGIFVLTAKGAPYYANQHAQKLLGRGIVRVPTDGLSETYRVFEAGTERLYPPERLPIVRALSGEVTECTDMEIRRGDEVVPLHVVGAPVHDAHGSLLYAVAGFQVSESCSGWRCETP